MNTLFRYALVVLNALRIALGVVLYSEVREVDHVAHGGFNENAHGVGNGVCHAEKFQFKVFAHAHPVSVFDHLNIQLGGVRKLDLPFFYDGLRHVCGVNGHTAKFHCEVGNGAYVVIVPVGQDDGLDVFLFGFQIGDIRDDEVYARGLFFGELQTHVNDDYFVLVFKE